MPQSEPRGCGQRERWPQLKASGQGPDTPEPWQRPWHPAVVEIHQCVSNPENQETHGTSGRTVSGMLPLGACGPRPLLLLSHHSLPGGGLGMEGTLAGQARIQSFNKLWPRIYQGACQAVGSCGGHSRRVYMSMGIFASKTKKNKHIK